MVQALIALPAQLAGHISGTCVRAIARGAAKGQITVDEAGEDKVAAELALSAE